MCLSEAGPKLGRFMKSFVEKYVQNQFRRRKRLLAVTWNCSCKWCWLAMKTCTPFIPLTSRRWCASGMILMRCTYSVSSVALYSSLLWHSLSFSAIYFDIYLSRFFCWKGLFQISYRKVYERVASNCSDWSAQPSRLAHILPMEHVNPLLPSPHWRSLIHFLLH